MKKLEMQIKQLFRAVHTAYTVSKQLILGGFGCVALASVFFHMRDHWWTGQYPGDVLNAVGLLYFKPEERYLIDGIEENRCMLVGRYVDYGPWDEDGFGYEEYYEWYYVLLVRGYMG